MEKKKMNLAQAKGIFGEEAYETLTAFAMEHCNEQNAGGRLVTYVPKEWYFDAEGVPLKPFIVDAEKTKIIQDLDILKEGSSLVTLYWCEEYRLSKDNKSCCCKLCEPKMARCILIQLALLAAKLKPGENLGEEFRCANKGSEFILLDLPDIISRKQRARYDELVDGGIMEDEQQAILRRIAFDTYKEITHRHQLEFESGKKSP